MKYLFLINTFLLIYANVFSNEVDSLFAALKKADNDSKLIIYEELCITYYSIDLDSAGLFAQKKMMLAKHQGNAEHEAISLKLLGNVNYFKGEYTLAIKYYEKALKLAQDRQFGEIEASAINNLGNIYRTLGDLDKSLKCFEQVLKIDSTNNNLAGIGSTLTNIGNIYLDKSQYARAIDYYKQALEIALNLNDELRIVTAYNNLGLAYHWISDYEKTSEYYILALKKSEEIEDFNSMMSILVNLGGLYLDWEHYSKSLELFNKVKAISIETKDLPNLVRASENIGIIYNELSMPDSAIRIFQFGLEKSEKMDDPNISSSLYINIGFSYELKKNYVKAKEYYQKSLDIREQRENDDDIASSLNSLGKIYYLTKDYETALSQIIRSNKLTEYATTKISNYQLLSDIYSKLKKPDKALEYYKLYSEMRDSVFTNEKHKQIQELQTQYETEKKEQTITSLSKEKEIEILKNERSKYYILSLLGLMLILTIVGILIFRNGRLNSKRKAVELEQKLLRSQMNPHFIFNAITCIQEYIMGKKPLEAGSYLSKFAKLMRSILNNSATEFISLDDEIETLEHYLQLQKMRFPDKMEYEIIVPDDMETQELAIPPMLSQPFIENAVKHGIAKKKDGIGTVTVEFSENNGSLLLKVQDNGVGLNDSVESKDKNHLSMATRITKNRIDNFKKSYKKGVHFKVSNTLNENKEIDGVQVLFELPKQFLS